MPSLLLEVIVQTVEDAVAATRGGADRLEVVRDIRQGGLTPALSLVSEIAAATPLPLRVMVRERDSYTLESPDLDPLRHAARELARLGVDGIVAGFATAGMPALDDLRRVVDSSVLRVTFHRAFDALRDPLGAVDLVAAVPGVDRILTSGGDGPPSVRADRLARLAARAAGRLTIVAGGGVDREALECFVRTACVREVHVGRAARPNHDPDAPVSVHLVSGLRAIADRSGGRLPTRD
jgi:copper homeostasis protein